jgi:hypothetical protein
MRALEGTFGTESPGSTRDFLYRKSPTTTTTAGVDD